MALVERWVKDGRRDHFVVNLRCGKTDPVAVLDRVVAPSDVLAKRCSRLIVKQLYHDRGKTTVMGTGTGSAGRRQGTRADSLARLTTPSGRRAFLVAVGAPRP